MGRYPILSLADARARAREVLVSTATAIAPTPAPPTYDPLTYEELANLYVERHLKPNLRSWRNVRSSLLHHRAVQPLLTKPAAAITRRELVEVVDSIAAAGTPQAAVNILRRFKMLFNWALDRDLVSTNPCERIRAPAKTSVRDIPLAEYKAIQQRLAKLVNSDPAVCDLPRVMRLPGFLHMKDRDNPYLVHPIQISDEPPFLFEQFSAALSAAEAAHPSLDATTSDHPFKGDDPHKGDLARDEVLIRYLVKNAQLDLSIYSEWIKLGIALKNTHKDAGFELWHNLSQEFGGYESWDDCSRSWKSIIPSSNPEDRLTMGSYAKRARDAGWRITFAFVPAPHLACAIAH